MLRSEARRIETNYVLYYYPLGWSTWRLHYRPYITRTSKLRVYNFYRDDGSRRIRRGSLRAGRFSSPVPGVNVPTRSFSGTQRFTNVYTVHVRSAHVRRSVDAVNVSLIPFPRVVFTILPERLNPPKMKILKFPI